MTPEDLEDEAARPRAPQVPLDPLQVIRGKRLAMIHSLYRQELTAVARLMDDIRAGAARPDALPVALAGLTLTENLSLFGTVCGRQCAVLQTHHDIEEQWMFPEIDAHADAAGGDALRAVVARLKQEHAVIHSQIGTLRASAEALAKAPSPAAFAETAADFAALDRSVRSHFGYEETELAPALGVLNLPL